MEGVKYEPDTTATSESRAFHVENGTRQDRGAHLWTVCVALLLALAVAGPLVFGLPLLNGFNGADSNFNLQLVQGYTSAMHAGQLFPRWLPDANAGFGSPVFYFYGRLPFFVAGGFAVLLHVSAAAALLWGMGLFRLLAFFTCRAWLRQSAGPRAADSGALAFVAVPFAMMLNSIGRIGYAETAATALIPLLLLSVERISRTRQSMARQASWLALLYAALAATHLPQTLLAFAVASLYAILLRGWPALLVNAVGAACGLLLSGPSVLPAIRMQSLITPLGWRGDPYLDIRNNFLFTLSRLHLYHFFAQELYLYSSWLLCLLVLLLAAFHPELRLKLGRRERALLVSLAVCLLAMTELFWPLWVYLPTLRTIQFPWRLFPSGIALAAGLLAALVRTGGKRGRVLLGVLGLMVVGQVGIMGTGFFLSQAAGQRFAEHAPFFVTYRLPHYAPSGMRERPKYAQIRSFPPEYIPAAAHDAGWHVSSDQKELLLGTQKSVQLPEPPPGLQEARNSDGSITLRGVLVRPVSLLLPSFYFPDEGVFGPGQGALSPDASSGLTRLALPAGSFNIRVAHASPTSTVTLGRYASVSGAILIALLFALSFTRSAMANTGGPAVPTLGDAEGK